MKKLAFLLFMLTIVICANGQNENGFNNPDEQIIINKEYDEDGNLIGYDSTYIHKWSNDTSLNFNFDDQFLFDDAFPDINKILNDFFNDSTKQGFHFPQDHRFSPFALDSFQNFPNEFDFPDIKKFQEQMQEHFNNFVFPVLPNPNDLNEEQKKELRMLQKKHQQEMEELKKKWEEK